MADHHGIGGAVQALVPTIGVPSCTPSTDSGGQPGSRSVASAPHGWVQEDALTPILTELGVDRRRQRTPQPGPDAELGVYLCTHR